MDGLLLDAPDALPLFGKVLRSPLYRYLSRRCRTNLAGRVPNFLAQFPLADFWRR
jgi:hypothetical protein